MSDEDPVIPPTDAPTQPEPGPGYWPDEWQRHIDRAEQNLVDNPPPVFPQPEPEPEPEPEPPVLNPLAFDPADHTVAEVEDYVTEHPDQRQAVLDAETNGKDRVTLVDWLQADAG